MTRSTWGHMRELSPGRWRVYWQQDKRQRSRVVYGTRDDAERALAALRIGTVPDAAITWGEFWQRSVVPTFDGLAQKTVDGYSRIWRVELSERLSPLLVASTDFQTVQAVIAAISAPSVQRHAFRTLRKACNIAVRDGILTRNPCDRTVRFSPEIKRGKTMLRSDGIAAFLEAVRGSRWEPLVLLEIGGGLRHEEACALLWDDVRPWRGYAAVRVSKALVTASGGSVLKEPKTRLSERVAVIGEPFASRLLALKGEGPIIPGRVPLGEPLKAGMFLQPTSVTHGWRSWCRSCDVQYIRFADMRSIFATLHGEAMSSDSLVSLAMGHSDGTTRGDNYQAATLEGLARIAGNLADYLTSCMEKDVSPDDFPF